MAVLAASDYANRAATDRSYLPGIFDTVFRNGDGQVERSLLLGPNPIIPARGYAADDSVRVTANTGANASVGSFSEGATPLARGKQTIITSAFAFKHFWAFVGQTGHAAARMGRGGAGVRDQDENYELRMALQDLKDAVVVAFLTDAAAHSIRGIISDATYAWGDASRSTSATLISYLLNASSAAISTSLLNKMRYRSKLPPYAARIQALLGSPLQAGKYAELISGKLAVPQGASDILPGDLAMARLPFFELEDCTTTEIYGLSDVDGSWGMTENTLDPSGFELKLYGPTDDSETLQIVKRLAIWCNQPQRQAKLYGLSVG